MSLLVACGEQSRIDPDARVSLTGRIIDVDGTPLGERPVRLGSGVTHLEGGTAVLTAGLFCLAGECVGDHWDATTDAEGRYRIELTGQDTHSTFGEAVSFLLTTATEPSDRHPIGASVGARFRIQAEDLVLPDLRLVDPALELRGEGASVVAHWETTTAPGPFDVEFIDRDGHTVWEAPAAQSPAWVDARVLEDVVGTAAVTGALEDRIDGSDAEIHWRSPALAYEGGVGAPPSRGAPCALIANDAAQERLATCPATDGDFGPSGTPGLVCPPADPEATCSAPDRLRVELGAAMNVETVIVRGCVDVCRVAVTSSDGSSSEVGVLSNEFGMVSFDRSELTSIDVITPEPSMLTEVSAWGTVDPSIAPLATPPDGAAAAGRFADTAEVADDSSRWPVAVAGTAALAAAAGLGVLLGRRTRGNRDE